jgi:surfactin synthase thioesterase subunit
MLAGAIRPLLDRPFLIFGHSVGALVGFELARYLDQQDLPIPVALFASGHRAPHLPSRRPLLHSLGKQQLRDELRLLGGTPSGVLDDDELYNLVLPALRADLELGERYEHERRPPLACPIFSYGGAEDRLLDLDELVAWHDHTRARFEHRLMSGGHFYLFENPAFPTHLVEDLRECLKAVTLG